MAEVGEVSQEEVRGHSCSICYSNFGRDGGTVPRNLQCGHCYCTGCLQKILNQTLLGSLSCPACKHETTIEGWYNDASRLPKNFGVLEILSAEDERQRTTTRPPQRPAPQPPTHESDVCPEHEGEVRKVICVTCNEVICIYCQVYGEHRNHDCQLLTKVAEESRQKIISALEALMARKDQLSSAKSAIAGVADSIRSYQHATVHEIASHFAKIKKCLQAREKNLKAGVSTRTYAKLRSLETQCCTLNDVSEKIDHIKSICNERLEGMEAHLVRDRDRLLHDISELDQVIDGCELLPVASDGVYVNWNEEFSNFIESYGTIIEDDHDSTTTITPINLQDSGQGDPPNPQEAAAAAAIRRSLAAGASAHEYLASLGRLENNDSRMSIDLSSIQAAMSQIQAAVTHARSALDSSIESSVTSSVNGAIGGSDAVYEQVSEGECCHECTSATQLQQTSGVSSDPQHHYMLYQPAAEYYESSSDDCCNGICPEYCSCSDSDDAIYLVNSRDALPNCAVHGRENISTGCTQSFMGNMQGDVKNFFQNLVRSKPIKHRHKNSSSLQHFRQVEVTVGASSVEPKEKPKKSKRSLKKKSAPKRSESSQLSHYPHYPSLDAPRLPMPAVSSVKFMKCCISGCTSNESASFTCKSCYKNYCAECALASTSKKCTGKNKNHILIPIDEEFLERAAGAFVFKPLRGPYNPSSWKCPQCTKMNECSTLACTSCQFVLSNLDLSTCMTTCTECGYLNSKDAIHCESCHSQLRM